MKKIKILYVRFANELQTNEIELFRGAILAKLQDASVLFHNHIKDNFRYSYPLIQYKRIAKKAAIVCIEEGTEAIGQLFSTGDFQFQLGERPVQMEITSIKAQQTLVQIFLSPTQMVALQRRELQNLPDFGRISRTLCFFREKTDRQYLVICQRCRNPFRTGSNM